jgi:hypothetical protein
MTWGYQQYIKADVVALELQSETSEIAFHQVARANGSAPRVLVNQHSLPLGVPLSDMDDMEETYANYVRDIVQSGLGLYQKAAYFADDSSLAKKLLRVASSFYTSGLETGSEVGSCIL